MTKILPRKHTLSADLIKDEDNTYNNIIENKDIISDEFIVENKNKNEKTIKKPTINLLLSNSSIEEALLSREIAKNPLNKIDDNSNSKILSPVKRKLKSNELCSESGENLEEVISFDAIEVNHHRNSNENDIKNNMHRNKVNLLLSQDSIEEQLIKIFKATESNDANEYPIEIVFDEDNLEYRK